ncbi:hypothetical protein [Streptomyces sp. NPDC017529]|uniref:hypothetical protein n=1 Tax=Streptomyces sp. NPDC017529 TaxID=3365000 RepID=UPI0037A91553
MFTALKTRREARREAQQARAIHDQLMNLARHLVSEAILGSRRTADGTPDVRPNDLVTAAFGQYAMCLDESEATKYVTAALFDPYGYRTQQTD